MKEKIMLTRSNAASCQSRQSLLGDAAADQFRAGKITPTSSSMPTMFGVVICSLLLVLISGAVNCIVVTQIRFIATKSGRTDYALVSETIELSCHYLMKDDLEDVKQVIWAKDGRSIIRWRKNQKGLDVLSYAFKGHVDHSSKYSHIIIHNVTTEMFGRYTCSIKTDLNVQEADYNLIVIAQAGCKLNDWHIKSDRERCSEVFQLDCRHMFPRPSPSCGLWDERAAKFIAAVPVLISEEEPPASRGDTWRVRYVEKFELPPANGSGKQSLDLFQYAGNLFLRCDIVVPETSWRLSLKYKMFDFADGCHQDPFETVERMRANYSHFAASRMKQTGYLIEGRRPENIEMLTSSLEYSIWPPPNVASGNRQAALNCWRKPRLGSLAHLSCASKGNSSRQMKFAGANLLECTQDGWLPLKTAPSAAHLKAIALQKQAASLSGAKLSQQDLTSSGGGDGQTAARLQHTAAVTRSEQPNELPGRSHAQGAADDSDDSANTLPAGTIPAQEILSFEGGDASEQQQRHAISWTPAQLAALLPRCVAIGTTKPRRRNQSKQLSSAGRKLPLVDKAAQFESGGHKSRSNNGDDASQPFGREEEDDDGAVGLLPSSSSAAAATATNPLLGVQNFQSLAVAFALLMIFKIFLADLSRGNFSS